MEGGLATGLGGGTTEGYRGGGAVGQRAAALRWPSNATCFLHLRFRIARLCLFISHRLPLLRSRLRPWACPPLLVLFQEQSYYGRLWVICKDSGGGKERERERERGRNEGLQNQLLSDVGDREKTTASWWRSMHSFFAELGRLRRMRDRIGRADNCRGGCAEKRLEWESKRRPERPGRGLRKLLLLRLPAREERKQRKRNAGCRLRD